MPIFRKQDDAPRERTQEDRERARAEREARRAARAGVAPSPDMGSFEERWRSDDAYEPPAADAIDGPGEPRVRRLGGAAPEATELGVDPRDRRRVEIDDEQPAEPAFGTAAEPPAPEAYDPDPPPPAATWREPEPEPPAPDPPPPAAAWHEPEPEPPAPEPPPPAAAWREPVAEPPAPEWRAPEPEWRAPEPEPEPLPPPVEERHAPAPPPPPEPPLQETAPFDPLAEEDAWHAEDEAWHAEEDAWPAEEDTRRAEATPPTETPSAQEAPVAEPPASDEARAPIVPPAARRARATRPPVASRSRPDDGERPIPAKRIPTRERRLPPTPPPPGAPAFSKRRRRRGRILAALALLLLAAFLFGLNMLFQPFKGEGGEAVTVRIPPNSTVADVGDLLAEDGIVDSSFLFVLRARLAGAELKAGTYQLKQDSSYGAALDALAEDPAAPRTVNVVIPEGRSRSETAPLVRDAGLEGSYVKASKEHEGFNPRRYGAPRNTRSLEGFLFPASYELKPGSSARDLVGLQLDAFRENIRKVDMRRAERRNLTVYDVLIIASMVEREATLAKERPIIAAVIHNRLRQGMPLGIDATIRYAVRNWSEPLKMSELNIDSPYNTRKNTGLPPTPIGSPGLDSIKAAADPGDVDYLFYVVKPNGDGAHNFSSTDEEFQRDVDAYNEERARRGGQSPADSGG